MEEIFFCIITEILFVSIGFLIMGLPNMMYLFPFDSKADCIVSFILIFFILTCVWFVAKELFYQYILKDGKGILDWLFGN